MRVEAAELRRLAIPLRHPNETSFGVQTEREVILVRLQTSVGPGWGECGASKEPSFSSEFNDGVELVLRRCLLPALLAATQVTAARVASILSPFRGHRMAKAALEMAVLDAELRAAGVSLANFLGAERDTVPVGVSIGLQRDIPALLETVGRFVEQGYSRVKLKIVPDWDIEPVRAVREHFGDGILLQVDANGTYTLANASRLAQLDSFQLLLIEQPLGYEDLTEHARLARRLHTPICLDESIVSAKSAADAIRLKACGIINIKPARVGGYLEARRIHDVCRAFGVPVWCGGMLETGLGRAASVALAALPGFALPGDTSASDRYFEQDITEPFVLDDGHLTVPTGPGLGVEVLPDALDRFTVHLGQIGPTNTSARITRNYQRVALA
jgi:O-succinylbenzoate synthase